MFNYDPNVFGPPPPIGAPVTPEQRLQKSVKKGLQKPAISPKSPTDYDTDPISRRLAGKAVEPFQFDMLRDFVSVSFSAPVCCECKNPRISRGVGLFSDSSSS
jgi:hypothetical protein